MRIDYDNQSTITTEKGRLSSAWDWKVDSNVDRDSAVSIINIYYNVLSALPLKR